MMLAAGRPPTRVRFTGNTLSTAGATPKLHCKVAVEQTCGHPILLFLSKVLFLVNHQQVAHPLVFAVKLALAEGIAQLLAQVFRLPGLDRKSTRLNSSH